MKKIDFKINSKSLMKLLVFMILFLVHQCQSFELGGCLEGYYGSECLQCDSSCKTCSDSASCDTCESYMFINSSTSLCESCPEGEYFDNTTKNCRDCNGSCDNECLHRKECFVCSPGEIFDIDNLKCVSECKEGQIEIISPQFEIQSICRDLQFYIDRSVNSSIGVELGTATHPYRSLKAAASDILNHHSHSDANITVYMKDSYLEIDTFYVINMTAISFVNHPDYQILGKKASLRITKNSQAGLMKKTRLHLLKHTDIDPSSVIASGAFTEGELSQMRTSSFGIICSRTNVEMNSLDIYSDDIEHLIIPAYLQKKEVRLIDSDFNITGTALNMLDPMNYHLENLRIDISKLANFVNGVVTSCNYPEAETQNTYFAKNIQIERSASKETEQYKDPSILYMNSGGNYSVSDMDCRKHSSSPLVLNFCVIFVGNPSCLPQDDVPQRFIMNNFTHDGTVSKERDGIVLTGPILAYVPSYRKFYIEVSNFEYTNIDQVASFGLQYEWGDGSEEAYLSHFRFVNVSNTMFVTDVLLFKSLSIFNFTYEDSPKLSSEAIRVTTGGDVNITNVKFSNWVNDGSIQNSAIDIRADSTSNLLFDDIHIDNGKISNVPFLKVHTVAAMVTLEHSSFTNVQSSGGSLFMFQSLNSFSLSNISFEQASPINALDSESVIFNLDSIYVEQMSLGEMKDITVENSSLTLLEVGNLYNLTSLERYLTMGNIRYANSQIPTNRALMKSANLAGNTNLAISISGLYFENIEFASFGVLFEMEHQLPQDVKISGGSFVNIKSGSIHIQGSINSGDISTKTLFSNCSFVNISSLIQPFIDIQRRSSTKFAECTFRNCTSLHSISGMMNIHEGSEVLISNSSFTQNSAVFSTLFKIQSESSVKCDNCTIQNNFGIANGIFEVDSFGSIEFVNSVINNNFGIQNLIGYIFLTSEPSTISNTSIFQNSMIHKADIQKEASSGCVNLCFLQPEMKAYLLDTDLESVSESEYLFGVVQGILTIEDSSNIYAQSLLVNSFLSTIQIDNSHISNLSFGSFPLNIISSTITLVNCSVGQLTKQASDLSFIIVNTGIVSISDLKYVESDSPILLGFNSDVSSDNLTVDNMVNASHVMDILFCNSFTIKNVLIANTTLIGDSLISVQNTHEVMIEAINMSNLGYKFATIRKSNVTKIENVTFNRGSQVFSFINSRVDLLSNSVFEGLIENGSGGVLSLKNTELSISNCTFKNNTAEVGGSINFECASISDCLLEILDSTFQNNRAQVKGGSIYYNYNQPTFKNTIFTNNTALYGNNFASYPARIGYVGSSPGDKIALSNIGSGVTVEEDLELALMDIDNQVMVLDDISQIIIVPLNSSISSIGGINVLSVKQGVAKFDSISFTKGVNHRSAKFNMNSKLIDSNKVSQVKGRGFFQKEIQVNFRDCQPGEQIRGDICLECPAGTFSINWNSTQCAECELDADCLGGTEISVKSGYWRRFHNSTKIVNCINKDACAGGYSADTLSPTKCATGYTGNLCAECLVNEETKYEQIGNFECSKCPSIALNSIRVIGMVVLVIAFFIFIIVINIRKTNESELSVLFRILMNYIQLVTVSTSFTNDYPGAIFALLVPINTFGSSTDVFMSFDCFISDYEVKGPFSSNQVFKLFLMAFLPIALFLLMLAMWVIINAIKPKWVKDMKRNLTISLITIVFILHPKLSERSIDAFRCVDIDENYKVARIDTTLECYSYNHLKWCLVVAFPIIAIWVVACPAIAFIFIYRGTKKRENSKYMEYFLMIYQGLKPKTFYWEFVNTTRKILILISLLFNSTTSICASVLVLVLSARYQIYLKPYKNSDHYKVEFLAMMAGVCTIISSLIYSQPDQIKWINSVILILVLIINAKFLLEWIYLLVKLYERSNPYLKMVLKLLLKCLCKKPKHTPNLKIEKKVKTKSKKLRVIKKRIKNFRRRKNAKKFKMKHGIMKNMDIKALFTPKVDGAHSKMSLNKDLSSKS